MESRLRNLTGAELLPYVEQEKGETYDGEAVETIGDRPAGRSPGARL